MRTKIVVLVSCVVGFGLLGSAWSSGVGAQTTTTDPTTTTTTVPTTTTTTPPAPEPPPAPAAPSQDEIDAFLRALVPAGSGNGRRIVYSNAGQRVWLIDDQNRLEKSYLVSGRRGLPSTGVYKVYSKSRHASSGSARMEYMVRFARGRNLPIGFHSIPYVGKRPLQTIAQLGTPRSHGCVRQWILDAAYLFMWAPIGTTVVVLP